MKCLKEMGGEGIFITGCKVGQQCSQVAEGTGLDVSQCLGEGGGEESKRGRRRKEEETEREGLH